MNPMIQETLVTKRCKRARRASAMATLHRTYRIGLPVFESITEALQAGGRCRSFALVPRRTTQP
jgi:hypothetical protein